MEFKSIIKCENCGCPIGICHEKGKSSYDEFNDEYSGEDYLCLYCHDLRASKNAAS